MDLVLSALPIWYLLEIKEVANMHIVHQNRKSTVMVLALNVHPILFFQEISEVANSQVV